FLRATAPFCGGEAALSSGSAPLPDSRAEEGGEAALSSGSAPLPDSRAEEGGEAALSSGSAPLPDSRAEEGGEAALSSGSASLPDSRAEEGGEAALSSGSAPLPDSRAEEGGEAALSSGSAPLPDSRAEEGGEAALSSGSAPLPDSRAEEEQQGFPGESRMKSVWVMMLFLHCALSERFNILGPDSPVVVTVAGSDVVLPCSVRRLDQSSLSAVDMNIKWTRPDWGDALVHFYENHKDVNTRQIPQYRERTALFKEELQNGNVSLRLSDVNTRDEGQYKCIVDSEFWTDEVSFNLRVEVIGERPVISVESYDSNSEQFSLLCESKGWRPRPDLQWLNSKGENQPAGDPEIQRHAELFTVKRSFTVHKNDIDTFYCRATLGEHTKEKEIKPGVL
ncbi:hypothetical protein MHYP_G00365640, partial [Metynnis hypsauchen]